LTNLGSKPPPNFLVTLPKITSPWQVSTLVNAFEALEPKLGLAKGALKVECMVETTQSILDHDGTSMLPEFIDAAKGRMTGAHFGTYDYTASCDITAAYQAIRHPAQLPSRYGTVYAFFLKSLPATSDRLKNFINKAAQATLHGDTFDDAATGQGLLNFFLRGVNCGALTEQEALATGLSIDELRGRSFLKILNNRKNSAQKA